MKKKELLQLTTELFRLSHETVLAVCANSVCDRCVVGMDRCSLLNKAWSRFIMVLQEERSHEA
jgi:hypothetical protein